ncbi:cation:proton antiporter [Brachybacterium nesterenkovii]|uniref:cation:proton antiporter n=1 Tax=Brachybacterium nesterenkovii TaxID=47847 RepID=UPI00321AAAA6
MLTIALLVGMLAATTLCVAIGERFHLPYPILMLVLSAAVAFIPGFPQLTVDPDIILPLFLPPLLFATAQHTSWGVFRQRWRTLVVMALGLTALTAFAVAGAVWLLVPGLGLPLALMLGAIVAPPDPVAVEAVAGPARMPRHLLTTLQTEGLFNDAVAIVLFQAALAAVTEGEGLGVEIAWDFAVGVVLAVAIGFAVGWVFRLSERQVSSLAARTALGIVAPFGAYILADELGASGVVAVVVTALETRRNARAEDGELRMTRTAFWNVANLLVTGTAFGLIGADLRDVVSEADDILSLAVLGLAVAAIALVLRVGAVLVLHLVTRRAGATIPAGWRESLVLTWCGMRGLATLALALAIPSTVDTGQRTMLVVVACTVLVVTLVPTGALLPWLLRVLHLQDDGRATREAVAELARRAQASALEALEDRLPELRLPAAQKEALVQRLRHLSHDLAPHLTATGGIPAVAAGSSAAGTARSTAHGAATDADPDEERLKRRRMRAARDIAVTAQTVALDAARAEVIAARAEVGIDPAAADLVLRRLDSRMMATPPHARRKSAAARAKRKQRH